LSPIELWVGAQTFCESAGRCSQAGRALSPKEASMLGALILGLVAGALARLVIPNDPFEHLEGWRSWLTSIVLGLVGAFVGWLIFTGLFGIGDTDVFDLGGLIGAVIGAILVLVAVGWFLRRTGHAPRRRTDRLG
jgi:uncharacterized membrane protein YeaQ/YmgE (transglycosylase-associated protein family)